ncbi:DNA invertase Pin-like site-specific DNA recombinase [Rhodobacter sp. JA431]|uniref:recombinase family protein n=1 Tax=Rhodobacter sp. JA431 TaxID=570013 RepID=UPI000BD060A5|nr:recombinase family protein [Rhodobacter sp. JA431]SOC03612.1 DNA invertase Pin-like site-specific DNA recombinase [Rhodobacter sp. JA431]
MIASKDRPIKAVGYIRLSTQKQAREDSEFEKQAERIRKACERRGFTLVVICDDTASGADPLGAVRRDGLNDAVARARYEGAALIIPEPTRLFRHVEAARDFLKTLDVPIFSVKDGRFMKTPALLRAIKRGEEVVHNIREGTSEAMAAKKAEGVEFSDSAVRKKAAQVSAKVRSQKAESIARKIASILRSDRAYRDLSHKALADLLNRQRLLTGGGRPWTQNSIRPARKRAEEIIRFEEEIDNIEDDFEALPVAEVAPVPAPEELTEDELERQILESNPNYGIF